MADGGFVIKFDGKEVCRCFAVAFDYDAWEYTVNEKETKSLPAGLKNIAVTAEG